MLGNKTEAAKRKILNLNPLYKRYLLTPKKITSNNAVEIIKNYDIVTE